MAAEFTQLIAPSGPWHKVWIAAHWDRNLKKQDYIEFDLCELLKAFTIKRGIISLRATGHLLLGICKIFTKKWQLLEDEATEVRTRLWLAFSSDPSGGVGEARKRGRGDGVGGEGAGGGEPVLREEDPELGGVSVGERALNVGKRHMARLEDITLKPPAVATKMSMKTRRADEEFGAMTGAELEAAMKELLEKKVFPTEFSDGEAMVVGEFNDTQPLVGMGPMPVLSSSSTGGLLQRLPGLPPMAPISQSWDTPRPLDNSTPIAGPLDDGFEPAPLDMDIEAEPLAYPPLDDADGLMEDMLDGHDPEMAADAIAVSASDAMVGAEPVAKKRRHTNFFWDETTEIPKEIYQGYVNDRSSITRKHSVDYTLLVPHNAPTMPDFTTTFTDLCPSLVECLLKGHEVAEKRRRIHQEAELAAKIASGEVSFPAPEIEPLLDVIEPADEPQDNFLTPLFQPVEGIGLVTPDLAQRSTGDFIAPMTDVQLLVNAPVSLANVITSGMDEEDQTENAEARVGYSGRTEKMHRFLAREFQDRDQKAISYEGLCKGQSNGRRDLIAGCFFELLVLKTNGVINVKQDTAMADIKITKANQWAR